MTPGSEIWVCGRSWGHHRSGCLRDFAPGGLFSIEISRNGKRRGASVFESNFEKLVERAMRGAFGSGLRLGSSDRRSPIGIESRVRWEDGLRTHAAVDGEGPRVEESTRDAPVMRERGVGRGRGV